MLSASMVPGIHMFCELITVPTLKKLVYQEVSFIFVDCSLGRGGGGGGGGEIGP